MNQKNVDFKMMEAAEVLELLKTDKDRGLAHDEVKRRLARDGYNEVSEKKQHPVLLFLEKFWNLNAWMLEFIILTSLLLHNYNDFYIVIALLLLNAILGFIQEYQALTLCLELVEMKLHI